MTPAQEIAALRRSLASAQRKVAEARDAWMRGGVEAWRAHVAGYPHRRAIESAARKHARMLGPTFEALLAARLVCVDVQPDGTRLTEESAARLVAQWASEGARIVARGERHAD